MSYPRTIRNYNAFVDGVSYFGKVGKGTLPAIKLDTKPFRGAGMDAPVAIDMGTQAMQAKLVFKEWTPDLIKMIGTRQRIVMRPAAMGEDDFSADTYIFTCGGRLTEAEFDEVGGGDDANMTIMQETDFLQIEKDGETLIKIDVENGVRFIGGVDQLGEIRAAMGI